jgi:hypothetical protein
MLGGGGRTLGGGGVAPGTNAGRGSVGTLWVPVGSGDDGGLGGAGGAP